jgi:hypothetical protein
MSEANCSASGCSATVTRYPTGVFGLSYRGSTFYWWGFSEEEAHRKIEHLRIPATEVEWRENFYDDRFDINDPRCYQIRRYIPQNTKDRESL